MRQAAWIAMAAAAGGGAAAMPGCGAVGFVATVASEVAPPLDVKAEYKGLAQQSVAVLVDADLSILYQQPLTQYELCSAITEKIAAGVPGVKVVDARQVVDFQHRNIYWNTLTYSELASKLQVTRLVLVDVQEYRLHEPGNVNIWRGVIHARIGVAEADGAKPNDQVYSTTILAAYPPDRQEGVVNANQQTIRLGAVDLFSRNVAFKFHDHQEERSRK
jgi:hypothetical protein